MKDSQRACLTIPGFFKYIKANNERFSTVLEGTAGGG